MLTIERSLSWITQARRNVRDYERRADHSAAHILWAFLTLMTRRIARQPEQPGVRTIGPATFG